MHGLLIKPKNENKRPEQKKKWEEQEKIGREICWNNLKTAECGGLPHFIYDEKRRNV